MSEGAYVPRRAVGPPPEPADDRPGDAPTSTAAAAGEHPLPPIRFTGLTKRFGPVTAVEELSFTVRPGRVTGFLGPNGAGKATTLRMLVGLTRPTSGTATFGDRQYGDFPQPQRHVGAALDATFHPGRSGRDHLRVLAPTAGVTDARVDEVLELVGLTAAARRRVGGYSLGMRQRLALGSAVLGDPDYLILDEPANGLDPEGIRWLRGFLTGYAAQGRIVLVSSHLLAEVHQTADDVAVIGAGRLLRFAPIADLDLDVATSRVRVVDTDRATTALVRAGLTTILGTDADGGFLRVETVDTARIGEILLDAGVAVVELLRERGSLEDTFFKMLDHQGAVERGEEPRS